jgi:hypothetical protein
LVSKWLADGRQMQLTEDFTYVDPNGKRWDAPVGSVVDGASIPRSLWTVVGGPFEGSYRNASVLHDVACNRREENSESVHLMFYHACRCAGVEEGLAKTLYAGVYFFGPQWAVRTVDGKRLYALSAPPPVDEDAIKRMQQYIKKHNPSIDEIQKLQLGEIGIGPSNGQTGEEL